MSNISDYGIHPYPPAQTSPKSTTPGTQPPTVKQAVHKKYNVREIKHPQVNKVDLAKVWFVGRSAALVSIFVSVWGGCDEEEEQRAGWCRESRWYVCIQSKSYGYLAHNSLAVEAVEAIKSAGAQKKKRKSK